MSMPDPTPDPEEHRTKAGDGPPSGGPDETTAQDAGPREEAGPEGLTVEDILSTPQSGDAGSADAGSGAGPDAGQQEAGQQDASAALAAERLEELRRLQAEFVNFKHRTAREKEQLRTFVTGDLLQTLLPVFDDIDAARQAGDLTEGPFAAIANKLEETLARQGLTRIGAVGERFDPNVHEAVLQQPTSEVEPDQVSMVLRSGFRVGDRVVRPAQVAVAVAE
ncbi:nucleotide exchange factor GrpE [Kocuria sp. M1R5S2]|uniref:nucleotide exchange factor GrpE n=1 Tax=Kocuria rhizosphaerae TaxID=3376285 RepID=UPI0037AE70AC